MALLIVQEGNDQCPDILTNYIAKRANFAVGITAKQVTTAAWSILSGSSWSQPLQSNRKAAELQRHEGAASIADACAKLFQINA